MKIDHHFPCLSPESADPAAIPLRLQVAELERELHHRRNSYPARVDKGRMHAHDAERSIDMMRALVEDLKADQLRDEIFENVPIGQGPSLTGWQAFEAQRARADNALAPFRWLEAVSHLQQEITQRRHFYPRWVTAATLAPLIARQQMERLEAVHYSWWRLGRHFQPDPVDADPRTAWRAHEARFDPASSRGGYRAIPASAIRFLGDARFDDLDPGDPRAPWIRAELYPDGPKLCPCGHHEGYHSSGHTCLFFRECRCAGLPPDAYTPRAAFAR